MSTNTSNTHAAEMGASYSLLLTLLPKIPLVARVVVLHLLRLSEPAKYVNLRTELVVSVLRSFCQPSRPSSVSQVQQFTLVDRGIKGRIWVSKVASPVPPETGIRDALLGAMKGLGDTSFLADTRRTDILPVEAEWTGYRADATPDAELPSISEQDKYAALVKACTSRTTILYLHGGAFYLLDPSSHRPTTKKLAKLTGGRCLSVKYRLAPQNPFPAALLDSLVAYFYLLYPPPGSFHEPVKPEDIVFAGDR